MRSRCEACRGDGGEPCGGVAGGRGGSAAGRDLRRLLSSSSFGSVNEIDDHSLSRRSRALRRGGLSEVWVWRALASSSGSAGPGLSPALVAQRGRRLHHRTCDRKLAATRPVAAGVGRGRARHAQPKETAGRRLSWCAIEQPASSGARPEESSGSSSGGPPLTGRGEVWGGG